tara:strand:- start:103 stop:327 length:225 start_codon:yes stop_codon:yes gene_type:complete
MIKELLTLMSGGSRKKHRSSKKGTASKTHPGDKNYTTKKGDKDYHEKHHDIKKKHRPFTKKHKKKHKKNSYKKK